MKLGDPLSVPVPFDTLSAPAADEATRAALAAADAAYRRLESFRRLAARLAWKIYSDGDLPNAPASSQVRHFEVAAKKLRVQTRLVDGAGMITFRGTANLTNWTKVNLRAGWTQNPPRHRGFHEAWMACRSDIAEWLDKAKPTTLVLTGHSLGAALAQLAAFDLAHSYCIERVFLFAPPMVGGPDFNDAYAQQPIKGTDHCLGQVSEGFVLLSDAIALPLPRLLGYAPGPHVSRIDRFGISVKAVPGLMQQTIDGMSADGTHICSFRRPGDAVPLQTSDLGPPTVIDQVMPTFKPMAAAGGLWGWSIYATVSMANALARATGFHDKAGYAKAFGGKTLADDYASLR